MHIAFSRIGPDCLKHIFTFLRVNEVALFAISSKYCYNLCLTSFKALSVKEYFSCVPNHFSQKIYASKQVRVHVASNIENEIYINIKHLNISTSKQLGFPVRQLLIHFNGNRIYVLSEFGELYNLELSTSKNISGYEKQLVLSNVQKFAFVSVPDGEEFYKLYDQIDRPLRILARRVEIMVTQEVHTGNIFTGNLVQVLGAQDFCIQKKYVVLYQNDRETVMVLRNNHLYQIYYDYIEREFSFDSDVYGNFYKICANCSNTYLLSTKNDLYGFGANSYGQCDGTPCDELVLIAQNVKKMKSSLLSIIYITTSNDLFIQGYYRKVPFTKKKIASQVLDFHLSFNRINMLKTDLSTLTIIYT